MSVKDYMDFKELTLSLDDLSLDFLSSRRSSLRSLPLGSSSSLSVNYNCDVIICDIQMTHLYNKPIPLQVCKTYLHRHIHQRLQPPLGHTRQHCYCCFHLRYHHHLWILLSLMSSPCLRPVKHNERVLFSMDSNVLTGCSVY